MDITYFELTDGARRVPCKAYREGEGIPAKTVLCGHGFGGHRDNRAAETFARRTLAKNPDAAVITFDWPGHGENTGETLSLAACAETLRLVICELRNRWPDTELYGYATSFGGYLFLKHIAAEGDPFRKAAFRCPAVDMHSVLTDAIMTEENAADLAEGKTAMVGFDRKVAVTPAFLSELKEEDLNRYDLRKAAPELLILHGTQDEIVPFESGKAFAGSNGIRFLPVEGADHRFLDPRLMDGAVETMLAFLGLN